MKKNRGKLIIGLAIVIIIIAVSIFFIKNNENRLTREEKEYITLSTSKIQNIHIINDENIFGKNGEGLFYTFVEDFEDHYGVTLNKITFKSTDTASGAVFAVSNYLPEDALEFYKDHYVYVGKKKETISTFQDLAGRRVGVLSSSASYLNNYLKNLNITLVSYNTKDELLSAIEKDEVSSILVPRIEYINSILEKDYVINYHLSDVAFYYYMSDVADSRLKSIMKKYFITWKEKRLQNELYKKEREIFTSNLKIEEKDLVSLQGKSIKYGLVNNSPYEVLSSGNIGGIITEYLKSFAKFSDIEIEYKRYNNPKKFIKGITNNNVELYMNYFTQTNNGVDIPTNIYLNYTIFAHEANTFAVNTLESLKNKTIYVEENTILASILQKNGLKVETYSREKEWNKIIRKKDAIIAIDSILGDYYIKHDLKKFKPIYKETTSETYSLKSMNNEVFNKLLTKYINYLDNNSIVLTGLYHNEQTEQKGSIISQLARYAFYFLCIVGLILFLIYHNTKKVRLAKKIKKEDKLKFIDQLTSLKNRNYLNENITSWNKNTLYPQTVIMIDLNRVQEINDTLGYEEGDKQIQAAANILIRSQLDNSDIIRTDGTEFMIYLVGYNQKQITSYIHKLNKEFKKMPYDYGVNMDYSMIESELKNIQDAINECVEKIKKMKEEKKEEKE